MSETDAQVETELLLPSFKVVCNHQHQHLGGALEDRFVSQSFSSAVLELASGKQSALHASVGKNAQIVQNDFLIGKHV